MHRAQDVRGMVGSRNASIPCLVLYEAASGCSEATLQKSPSAVRSMAAAGGIRLTECNTAIDHAHLLLELQSEMELPAVMKALKGKSAHRVFQEVPELKLDARTNHLWQRGYNWSSCHLKQRQPFAGTFRRRWTAWRSSQDSYAADFSPRSRKPPCLSQSCTASWRRGNTGCAPRTGCARHGRVDGCF